MQNALEKPMTLAEFIDWEDRQDLRHEFDGSRPVAMAGGTSAQAFIQSNIIASLSVRLRGSSCRVVGSDLKFQTADGQMRCPDALVLCAPVGLKTKIVYDPIVVFEILSDSSYDGDLVIKNAEYRATPSVQRYVVLQQTHAGGVMFTRKGDEWLCEIVSGSSATLAMTEIGIEVPLEELYAGLDFDAG